MNYNTRIQLKYDTSTNWTTLSSTFIPLKGEIIIYSDISRFKIGDGNSLLKDLPFFDGNIIEILDSLQLEMTELKKTVSDGKSLIAAAITEKNVSTAADASFETMAENIGALRSGDKYYRVQVGAFSSLANAENLQTQLQNAGFDGIIVYPTY